MSEKRKLESDSDTDSELIRDNKSVKRKIVDTSDDDNQLTELMSYEEEFDKRYTEEDEEYKKCLQRPDMLPPILTNYFGKNRNRDRFRGNDRYQQRGRGGQHYNSYDNQRYNNSGSYGNRRSNWNQRPYNRY